MAFPAELKERKGKMGKDGVCVRVCVCVIPLWYQVSQQHIKKKKDKKGNE